MSKRIGTILYIYDPVNPNNMSEELFNLLAKDHYILYFNGELVVTNKFIRTFATPPRNPAPLPVKAEIIPKESDRSPVVLPDVLPGLMRIEPLKQKEASPLLQFIRDCEVPEKIKTATSSYWCNRFSTKAEKELILILTKGYQYDILVAATKLYYKSGGLPKMISNYILEGVWRGCYEDMQESLRSGTVNTHIKSNMDKSDDEGFTKYKR